MNVAGMLLWLLTLQNPTPTQMARVGRWVKICCPREECVHPKMRPAPPISGDGVYWWYEEDGKRVDKDRLPGINLP